MSSRASRVKSDTKSPKGEALPDREAHGSFAVSRQSKEVAEMQVANTSHVERHQASGTQIFDRATTCFDAFDQFFRDGDARYHDFARNLRDRLATWNKYSGASAKLGYRLDDRLSGLDTIIEAFVALLDVIVVNITYARSNLSAKREGTKTDHPSSLPLDSDIIFEQTSIKETFEQTGGKPWGEIILAISELLNLTRTVRESSVSNRESPVPIHYQRQDSDFFEQTCRILTRARFPDARSTLTDQLSKSITVRRNRLLYRRDHEEKLRQIDEKAEAQPEPEMPVAEPSNERTPRAARGLTAIPEGGEASGLQKTAGAQQPPTILSRPRQSLAVRPRRELKTTGSVFGRSNRMEADLKAMYPDKPTPDMEDKSHGTCPYCFVPQPLPISDDNWRAHIDKDLQVYICLSEHCADTIKFFDRSDAWLNHMHKEHGATWMQNIHLGLWFCNLNHDDGTEEMIFPNAVEFELHLREAHKSETRTIDIYRRRKRRRGDTRVSGVCPLCEKQPESGGQLLEHITGHLRSLAMLSLPGFDKEVHNYNDPVSIDPVSKASGKRTSQVGADQTGGDLADETDSDDLKIYQLEIAVDYESPIIQQNLETQQLLYTILLEKTHRFRGEKDEILLHLAQGTQHLGRERNVLSNPESTLDSPIWQWAGPRWRLPIFFAIATVRFRKPIRKRAVRRWKIGLHVIQAVNRFRLYPLIARTAPSQLLDFGHTVFHENAFHKHHPGTCSWLLTSKEYREWKTGLPRSLYIFGKVGCGKTVLCSVVIEDVRKHCESVPNAALTYFYFHSSDPTTLSHEGLLRTLIAQLSAKLRQSATLVQDFDPSIYQPMPGELERLALMLLRSFDDVFLLIDGLNECPKKNEALQGVLATLQHLSLWSSNSPWSSNIRTLVTSRYRSEFQAAIQAMHARIYFISPTDTDNDIGKYVAAELSTDERLCRIDRVWKSETLSYIDAKADGVFTWANCQLGRLKSLDSCTPVEINRVLESLPNSLQPTYMRILDEIADNFRPEVVRLLRWLAYGQEPLHVREIAQAMIIDPTGPGNMSIDDILDILGDIIVIETDTKAVGEDRTQDSDKESVQSMEDDNYSGSKTVRFAHDSIRVYLESEELLQTSLKHFHLNAGNDHGHLVQWCIDYLLYYVDSRHRTSTAKDLDSFKLLGYAARQWYEHFLRSLPEDSESLDDLVVHLLGGQQAKDCWLLIHEPDRPDKVPFQPVEDAGPSLYYASYLGLTSILNVFAGENVNAQGGYYGTPLQAAASKGHQEVVEYLLSIGADPNVETGAYGTALQAAVIGGYEVIVVILLHHDADFNAGGGGYGGPLQAASSIGHNSIVETIIHMCVIATTHREILGESLRLASQQGHFDVVCSLIVAGADVNFQSAGNFVALHEASFEGHLEIVRELLQAGADVDTIGWQEYRGSVSALSLAADNGHAEVVELLIQRGATIDLPRERTALDAAAAAGQEKVVKILLEAGTPISGLSLLRAAGIGYESVVEMLIRAGADVNAYSATTPLEAAVSSRNEKVVEMLLQAGAKFKKSLLVSAAASSDEQIQTLLRVYSSGNASLIVAKLEESGKEYLRINECPLVCDAGYDSVVVTSYQVKQIQPQLEIEEVKELVGVYGATLVNVAFKRWLRDSCIGREAYAKLNLDGVTPITTHTSPSEPMAGLMKQFEEKRQAFSTSSMDIKLDLPPPLNHLNVKERVRDGELTVYRKEMQEIFNSSINGILELIEKQFKLVAKEKSRRVKNVFLLGSFSDCPYLQEKVWEYLPLHQTQLRLLPQT